MAESAGMSETPVLERTRARIDESDLRRLAELEREEREAFFRRKPRWRPLYADRLLCVALCQGAALHYLDNTNGVKDLDVWTFYAAHPETPFPQRWYRRRDFGPSHLGRNPAEPEFTGRRVDFFARSIRRPVDADPVAALRTYLAEDRNKSPRLLAKKAVVLLEPAEFRGRVIWPKPADWVAGQLDPRPVRNS